MGFGTPPIKQEGAEIPYDEERPVKDENYIKTTYIERRVPEWLEAAAHDAIDNFLRSHGYDPKEL